MAAPYDIYPAVDSTYNFPPVIRQALVQSTDVQAALAAERSTTNTRFDTERQITNDQFVFERTVTNQKFGTERTQTNADRNVALADYDTRAVVAARGRTKSYADITSLIADVPNLNNGDLAIIGRYQYSNGILHRASTWMKQGGILTPVGPIIVEAVDRSGAQAASTNIVNQFVGKGVNLDSFYNQEFRNCITSHSFYWDGGRIVPRKGFLIRRRWGQWAYGPAPRADWWAPPMDVWNDDYGVAWGNCFVSPTAGWYQITGRFGYQQGVENERVIAAVQPNDGGADTWCALPRYMWSDTSYPFSIKFYSNYNVGWNFRVYHSGSGDFYAIRGEASVSQANEFVVDFLGSNA